MKYVIPIIVGIVVFFYIIISTIGGPSGSETSSGSENDAKCSQWDSKNAVEERIESLGHTQVSINLNDKADCRYQWLVQFISRNGASEWCAITTDGSSGVVEIVDVSCN